MASPAIPDWARRPPPPRGPLRVVLVGPCAAGKSTLAAALEPAGYEVHQCAQEHSEIPHLWALAEPDLLVYLSVDLPTIRQRRANPAWPASLYQRQLHRLEQALTACDVYIDTSRRAPDEVAALARAGLVAARRQ
jgi:hypothetical protein